MDHDGMALTFVDLRYALGGARMAAQIATVATVAQMSAMTITATQIESEPCATTVSSKCSMA